jgi:hypothetical protein
MTKNYQGKEKTMKLDDTINQESKSLAEKIEQAIIRRHTTLDNHCFADPGYVNTPYYATAMEQIQKLGTARTMLLNIKL